MTATLKCVQRLFGLARWGFDHKLVDRLPALPRGWKGLVRRIWGQATAQAPRADRPGYSEAEVRQFFSVLDDIDPRIALMLQVALGARMGQARRVTRRMVEFPADQRTSPTLTIPGGGDRKPGMTIDLSPRAVGALKHAFTTYLDRFERAFQARLIVDYWLFPGGFVGYLQSDLAIENAECITEQYLGELFDEAETLAGVEKKAKRRMHGLRRFVRTRGLASRPTPASSTGSLATTVAERADSTRTRRTPGFAARRWQSERRSSGSSLNLHRRRNERRT